MRMRRHRGRQDQPLHARGAGQLAIEPIAALRKLALEMLARQMRGDARQHFFGLDRFGDVVDGAQLEARHFVGHLAARRQEDDGRVPGLGVAP